MPVVWTQHIAHAANGGTYEYFDVGRLTTDVPTYSITATCSAGNVDVAVGWCDASNTCFAPGVPQALGWWQNANFSGTRTGTCVPNTYVPNAGTRVVVWTRQTIAAYTLDITVSGTAYVPPLANCGGHYRIKPGNTAGQIINDALVTAASAAISKNWLGTLLSFFFGEFVDLNVLCASGPPSLSVLDPKWLAFPGTQAQQVLYATLWPYFCECDPAYGTNTPPPPPPWSKPPSWPDDRTYPVNPTNPCLDLTEVRRKLDALLQITQQDLQLDTLLQRYGLPFATVPGAVHSGLTGGGSFAIGDLVGVRIEWTGGEAAAIWEGTPPYYKDLGWASASDGGAMLLETRVTRTSMDWCPRNFQMATSFGYFAKPGVTLKVTELQAET